MRLPTARCPATMLADGHRFSTDPNPLPRPSIHASRQAGVVPPTASPMLTNPSLLQAPRRSNSPRKQESSGRKSTPEMFRHRRSDGLDVSMTRTQENSDLVDEKVGGCQDIHVRSDELLPAGPLLTLRSGGGPLSDHSPFFSPDTNWCRCNPLDEGRPLSRCATSNRPAQVSPHSLLVGLFP